MPLLRPIPLAASALLVGFTLSAFQEVLGRVSIYVGTSADQGAGAFENPYLNSIISRLSRVKAREMDDYQKDWEQVSNIACLVQDAAFITAGGEACPTIRRSRSQTSKPPSSIWMA